MEKFAYLAGLIDGEGTITIYRHAQHNRKSFQFKPRLIVSNTSKDLMEFLISEYGGTFISCGTRGDRWRNAYQWMVCSIDENFSLLSSVKPWILIKKEQASLLLEFLSLRKAAKVRDGIFLKYSDREAQIWEIIRNLNAR